MYGQLSQAGWKILRGLYHGESKISSRELNNIQVYHLTISEASNQMLGSVLV